VIKSGKAKNRAPPERGTAIPKQHHAEEEDGETPQGGLLEACEKGKSKKASHRSKEITSITEPIQLIHMDLFGPVNVLSLSRKIYALVIVDDYSKYTWVFFLK